MCSYEVVKHYKMVPHGRSLCDVLKCRVRLLLLLPPFAPQLTSHTEFFAVCSCRMALPGESPEAMEPSGHGLSAPKLSQHDPFVSACKVPGVFHSSDGSMDNIPFLLRQKRPSRIFHAAVRAFSKKVYESRVFRILIITINEKREKD